MALDRARERDAETDRRQQLAEQRQPLQALAQRARYVGIERRRGGRHRGPPPHGTPDDGDDRERDREQKPRIQQRQAGDLEYRNHAVTSSTARSDRVLSTNADASSKVST